MVVSLKLIITAQDARRPLMRCIQNSPYAEVRAAVDNHDDPNMPASTFRSWATGTFLVVGGSFFNQVFSIKASSYLFGYEVTQLLCVRPALIPHKQRLTVDCGQRFSGGQILREDPSDSPVYHFRIHLEPQPRQVQHEGAYGDHHHG
jgi:hypothetical protein